MGQDHTDAQRALCCVNKSNKIVGMAFEQRSRLRPMGYGGQAARPAIRRSAPHGKPQVRARRYKTTYSCRVKILVHVPYEVKFSLDVNNGKREGT